MLYRMLYRMFLAPPLLFMKRRESNHLLEDEIVIETGKVCLGHIQQKFQTHQRSALHGLEDEKWKQQNGVSKQMFGQCPHLPEFLSLLLLPPSMYAALLQGRQQCEGIPSVQIPAQGNPYSKSKMLS